MEREDSGRAIPHCADCGLAIHGEWYVEDGDRYHPDCVDNPCESQSWGDDYTAPSFEQKRPLWERVRDR